MILLVLLYIVIPLLQVYVYLTYNYAFDFMERVNYIVAIASLIWMLSNVILASKVPYLQKVVPYDKRIKAHIFTSVGVVCFAIYHGLYKLLIGYSISAAIPFAVVILLFMGLSYLWIKRSNSRYDLNKKFHIYAQPVIGGMMFYHIYSAELFFDIPLYSSVIYILMFVIAYGLFILSKTGFFTQKCKVVSVKRVKDIHILELEALNHFRYKSGQFAFLSYRDNSG